MLCQQCKKNNASIFYKETVNGKTTSYALCPECAAKLTEEGKIKEVKDPFTTFFDDPFGDLFNNMLGIPANQISSQKSVCPDCGCTLSMIQNTGMLGCPTCYRFFAEALEPTVRNIHGNTRHIGKIPGDREAKKAKKDKLASLKKELSEAIKAENFEQAAVLRDQIRDLESSDGQGQEKTA